MLSLMGLPLGLPLHHGSSSASDSVEIAVLHEWGRVEPCSYCMQKGHFKFRRTIKFDHPLLGCAVSYGLIDIPIAPYMTMAPSGSFSEWSKMNPHSSSSAGLMFLQGPTLV